MHDRCASVLIMELYQLRTFLIVAEEGSITGAARRLYTTPPSVSAHIKALEEEWGVVLFQRNARGMSITAKGEALLKKADDVLRSTQDLTNHAIELQDALLGSLSVGVNAAASYLRIAEVLDHLSEHCPGLEVILDSSTTGRIVESLKTGELDAGYLFGPVTDEDITAHRLGEANLVVIAPTSWGEELDSDDWVAFAKRPWIVSDERCPFQDIIDRWFAERGLSYERGVNTSDDHTKLELVREGLGLALLEQSEAHTEMDEGKVLIRSTEPIRSTLSFGYLSANASDPLIRPLRAAVLAAFNVLREVAVAG